jgi:hypothetical protein
MEMRWLDWFGGVGCKTGIACPQLHGLGMACFKSGRACIKHHNCITEPLLDKERNRILLMNL